MKVPEDRLLPITVRFSPDAWAAIRDIAYSSCISQAELVRLTVAGNLGQYLGTVKLIDRAQADELKAEIMKLFTAVSDVGNELNRIGVNYNQVVRDINTKRKYGNTGVEEKAGGTALPIGELNALISRYEEATEGVRDLCRILT